MFCCRASTQTQPKSPTRQQENGEREEEEKEEEEEEEEGRIVPQLRIGKDGNIVLDEQRYTCRELATVECTLIGMHAAKSHSLTSSVSGNETLSLTCDVVQ